MYISRISPVHLNVSGAHLKWLLFDRQQGELSAVELDGQIWNKLLQMFYHNLMVSSVKCVTHFSIILGFFFV